MAVQTALEYWVDLQIHIYTLQYMLKLGLQVHIAIHGVWGRERGVELATLNDAL